MTEPFERRENEPVSRRVLGAAAYLAVVLLVAGLVAEGWRSRPTWPGGYIVEATTDNTSGWSARGPVARAVRAGDALTLTAARRMWVVQLDGRVLEAVGPMDLTLNAVAPTGLDFLRSPLVDLLNAPVVAVPTEAGGAIRVLSPVGVTRFTNPLIAWRETAGVTYEVVVRDASDEYAPLRIMRGAKSPVRVAELETTMRRTLAVDRMYQVYVGVAGGSRVIGGAKFLVRADGADTELPQQAEALLLEAVDAMARRPTRTGDAWIALSRLPREWANTELAVRLRLRVAAELGLDDEVATAREQGRRLLERW